MLRSSSRYAPRVDQHTPIRLQLLPELLGDFFQTREQMQSN